MDKETKDYIDSKFNELMSALVPDGSASGKASNSEPVKDPLADWNDPDIYPVWVDESKPHTLDNLDGIHVPAIDGTEILLYPKYKELPLLPENIIKDWSAKEQSNPLYADIDQNKATDELLSLGSEAAEFVRQFGKNLALPIQLLAIAKHKEKIDKLSSLLGGDLLSEIGSLWWSCLRSDTDYAWCVYGTIGAFSTYGMYISYQCLPVSLFKKN